MGLLVEKEQYIFIQSKNRTSGNTYDFEVNIADGILQCGQDEVMAITMMNFDMPFNWYMVNSGNNSVTFRNVTTSINTTVTIPEGNYNYKKLADCINQLYPHVYCEYLVPQNKFLFSFQQQHQIIFIGASYNTLGFSQGETPQGITIMSPNQITTGTTITELCVRLDGITPYKNSFNVDMMRGTASVSMILLSIPFITNPFQLLSYTNYNHTNTMYIDNKKLNMLRIQITDFDDNLLGYINDYTMTLQIQTFKIDSGNDDVCEKIDKLINITQLNLYQKHFLNYHVPSRR